MTARQHDRDGRAQLVSALQEMVYETTHLSREEEDGSHWCKISKAALTQARQALDAAGGRHPPPEPPDGEPSP